ncbi:hypothetical protein PEX1_007380 [Penicillium expansum]|uniref:Uncharacterized protein n=1 Tax=Penicillium expansum TaxID=27334 RepID=A0A0A2K4K1_PENEN|nr:hypothetical protein PEX2_012450 [Penicillium expansum]KGO38969.1 hypothetical protein PEXP_058480 [Penicillium expansum]KGO61828.1 hypothetical protein PEX1_007380 [Penicillium expansum]KGO62209.1 hypothetical protein PEX2_012450 [Penicillium expansum]
MASEMDTFAARLASFDIVLKPEKRRSSGTKTPKAITWPHQRPSPAELAHAGFYYKPYETNPDNTTCFECHRALDGWEEDDNPVTEHLKHAPDCGWAIMMDLQQSSSNPASIEDPTGDRITQARLATFGTAWPHDGKKGWMVEGGWYFCPTDESNDLASCVYCKLSLDGWEPKDDPFDEHYRRSSDCSFFVFAQPPGKKSKSTRSKKPRVSKTSSRLSTQSVGPVSSEAPDMEMDDSMDHSIISQPTTKSKSTKKAAKSKSKGTKTKKEESAEVESQVEADIEEVTQPEPLKPKRAARGKKRASEDIKDEPEPVNMEEREQSQPPAEPPAKRRATKTRSSSIARNYNYEHSDSAMADVEPVDDTASEEETNRGRKLTKKSVSKARKVSDVPAASKAPSKARAPRDSEIETEIEAGVEADFPKPAQSEPEIEAKPEEARASKKTKSSKKSKAVAKIPEPTIHDQVEDASDRENRSDPHAEPVDDETEAPEPPAPKSKSAKGSKKKGTKKTKTEETIKAPSPEPRESLGPSAPDIRDDSERHDSFISVEIVTKEPEHAPEPDVPMVKAESKKVSKKKDGTSIKEKKSKKSAKKTEQAPVPEPLVEEHRAESSVEEHDDEFETTDDLPDQLEMINPPQEFSPLPQEMSPEPQSHRKTPSLPPKTAKRYSDIPHEEHLAETLVQSQGSPHEVPEPRRNSKRSNRAVSPLPPAHQNTPSLSPQSSDAENQPPSSRPSASRPPVQSTPKHPEFRAPLAVSTPSPSKRNANGGFGPSGHPWTPVDIDEVLFGEASDKENADLSGLFKGVKAGLTSPEKKMTVQEWIAWNAKNGEERLKRECERLVGQFEKEGGRAMQRLEAIECID